MMPEVILVKQVIDVEKTETINVFCKYFVLYAW